MEAHGDVTVEARWRQPTWIVNGRMLCWPRAFSKADLRRFEEAGEVPPAGDIVAITVSSLAEKDALLFAALPGFFTIPHFNGYPAVLVALASARSVDVMPLLERSRQHLAAQPPKRGGAKSQPKTRTAPDSSPKRPRPQGKSPKAKRGP